MIPPEVEEELLVQLHGRRRERREGLDRLFELARPELFALALRMTGTPDLADDAVQEAFVDVLGGIAGFRGESRLSTWLFRITVRAAARVASRTRGRAEVLPEDLATSDSGPSDAAEQRDAAVRVLRAIAKLSTAQRAVVALLALDGVSQAEAAEVLGLPVGTVYSRLHEARSQLRATLAAPDANR